MSAKNVQKSSTSMLNKLKIKFNTVGSSQHLQKKVHISEYVYPKFNTYELTERLVKTVLRNSKK